VATPDINKILAAPCNNASSRFGASMGRIRRIGEPAPLYLQRIRFVDGDYDTGGAYWGGRPSSPLWCAFSEDMTTRIFVRADNRKDAKNNVQDKLTGFTGFTFHK